MFYDKTKSYPVQPHPTWDIMDASKLKTYLTCERMFFFEYVLGWRPDFTSNHLHFGSAHHEAMEFLTRVFCHPSGKDEPELRTYNMIPSELVSMIGGINLDQAAVLLLPKYPVIEYAFNKFFDYYRNDPEFTPETDEFYAPKTPGREALALLLYAHNYATSDRQNFTLLEYESEPMTELRIPVMFEDYILVGKVDAIVQTKEGKIRSLEHKTGTPYGNWGSQWDMDIQPALYSYMLYMMYGADKYDGVLMNGVLFNKRTKLDEKKDIKDPDRHLEFARHLVRKQPGIMQAWYTNTLMRLDDIHTQFKILADDDPKNNWMMSFPMRENHCNNFYGRECSYKGICMTTPNPLKLTDYIPSGFKEEWWNPMDEGKRTIELKGGE